MHYFPAIFFVIKRYQDILFKLIILSTDSVAKKITGIRAVYHYNSGSIFVTKKCERVCFQSKKLYEGYPGIVRSGKCGLENGVYLSG